MFGVVARRHELRAIVGEHFAHALRAPALRKPIIYEMKFPAILRLCASIRK